MIEGDAIETLMNLLKKSFPHESLSDFVDRHQRNKGYEAYYLSLYKMQSRLYPESKPLREPSKKCQKFKSEVLSKWGSRF